MKVVIGSLSMVLLLGGLEPALSWGDDGHKAIALIAQRWEATRTLHVVWNLETIPDIGGFVAANDFFDQESAEVREVIGAASNI